MRRFPSNPARLLVRLTRRRRRAETIERYRLLARRSVELSAYVVDRDLRLVMAESSRLSEQEIVPALEPAYRAALDGAATMLEVEIDNDVYWVHVMPWWDEDRICGGLALAQRITERRNLERQLIQSQKVEALGRLAGSVAHDFNNMLASINGYTAMALGALGDKSPESAALMEKSLAAAASARELTQRLLTFARKGDVAPVPVDVNDVVTEARQLLQPLLRGVEVQLELDGDRPVIAAQPGDLTQVVVNLVVNARDATEGRGCVEVRTWTEDDGGTVALSVTDDGQGMDDATRGRIFEPFFTTKPPGSGTGLGLVAVARVVEQLNGVVDVDSRLGAGSTFTIRIPAELSPRPVPLRPA